MNQPGTSEEATRPWNDNKEKILSVISLAKNDTICRDSTLGCPRRTADVISDIDIYRVTKLLIERHRQDAPIRAAMRAHRLLENRNLDGYVAW